MEKTFSLPAVSCPDCNAGIDLSIATAGASLKRLVINCTSCDWELDLLEEAQNQYAVNRDRAKKTSREVSRTIIQARQHLPRDKGEWAAVLRNRRHPFTLAVLTGLVIVAMELSGFGIFLALTWILGNLILNPVGWVLIPLLVAVAVMYRNTLRRDKIEALKRKLDDLDQQLQAGTISKEQHREMRREFLDGIVS